jgi:next-to-BRCA1 protein 1
MATFVLKIEYEEVLRRMTVPQREAGYPPRPAISFNELEESIRTMFKIPSSSEIVVTYMDKDNDVITLMGDEDLYDACAVQGLNPLRLHVTSFAVTPAPTATPGPSGFRRGGFSEGRGHGGGFGGWGPLNFWNIPQVHLMGALAPAPVAPLADEGVTNSPGNNGNPLAPASSADVNMAASDAEDANQIHHFGIQCDSCNMFPIVGLRFKSNKKFDFDLCEACFQKSECASDEYTRIERPMFRSHHFPSVSAERRDMGGCPWRPSPYYRGAPLFAIRGPHGRGRGSFGGKAVCGSGGFACESGVATKLDARFVQDVTIFDGTELAPGTSFTKIWRLRNSGSVSWPKDTQLVHVGGDELGSVDGTTLELPEEGLAPEQEVEASVDLVAPMKPGRYVSYWRLVAPFGAKFGHRVWVLIQVIAKNEESPQVAESLAKAGENAQESDKMEVEKSEELAADQPVANDAAKAQPEVDVVIPDAIDTEYVGVVEPAQVAPEQHIEAKKVDEPEVTTEVAAPVTTVGDVGKELEGVAEAASELGNFSMVEVPDETAILATLEGMGFKDKSWNTELLKINNNDMQRTLDDLVASAEWAPKLEELEEMGFIDKELNRRLMMKNKGSLKRVVKELVYMYKNPAGKGKEY